MKIDSTKCIACGLCIPYCPMSAIEKNEDTAEVNLDECVECGVCLRINVCPVDAIYQQPLEWPRSVRSIYSDPLNVHKETDLAGRGTEEIKTNDVTGRFKRGMSGVALEVGRPGIGARLIELEKLSVALVKERVTFEPLNPLTNLIDEKTGKLPEEILQEKVMSAIIEFAVPNEKLLYILDLVKEVTDQLDTVVSVDVASRANKDGSFETIKIMDGAGIKYRPNAKINVGLGKPAVE